MPERQSKAEEIELGSESIQRVSAPEDYETIIDWNVLEEYSEGHDKEKKAIVQMFLNIAIADLKRLKNNIFEKDVKNWDEIIHKVSGAASYVGARKFVSACEKAQEQKEWNDELMPGLYDDIISNFKLAYEELNTRDMQGISD